MSENKKLTLVDRAFALPDSEKEFGMKIADHKLICNVLDDHMDSIMDNVDEKILKTLQSDTLTDTIADKVYEKLAEFNAPVLLKLETLINGQTEIAEDIFEIKERLSATEEKVGIEEKRIEGIDKRLDAKKKRIERLESEMRMLQPESIEEYSIEIHKVKPILDKIVKMFSWWRIAIYILIVAILAALVVLTLHKNGYLGQLRNDKQSYKEWAKELETQQIKGYSTITRGSTAYKMTDAEIDTLENQTLRTIKARK